MTAYPLPEMLVTEVPMLKDLIEYIAKSLVDHPEQVQVAEVEGEQTSVLELKVAKEDLGKVIGYGINWALQDLEIEEMNALLS